MRATTNDYKRALYQLFLDGGFDSATKRIIHSVDYAFPRCRSTKDRSVNNPIVVDMIVEAHKAAGSMAYFTPAEGYVEAEPKRVAREVARVRADMVSEQARVDAYIAEHMGGAQ